MEREKIIGAFSATGKVFTGIASDMQRAANDPWNMEGAGPLHNAARMSMQANPFFIPAFLQYAFSAWGYALQEEKVIRWLGDYPSMERGIGSPKTVGLVMAGNLPMVGLHDLLCVLASGHRALVKLSGQDMFLVQAVVDVLSGFDPELAASVKFTEGKLEGYDAIIATGSNNTARYFDYYFGRVPNIIRRNRNGVAIITGTEQNSWYEMLADDIFLYFGLGCRNVSKVYLPEGFDPGNILHHFSRYAFLGDHHKYRNNYDYQKSIMMINRIHFEDNGFLIMKQDRAIPSAVSVVHYEFYQHLERLQEQLAGLSGQIQCVVAGEGVFNGGIEAGSTQVPELWDYADGVDTIDFLSNL